MRLRGLERPSEVREELKATLRSSGLNVGLTFPGCFSVSVLVASSQQNRKTVHFPDIRN